MQIIIIIFALVFASFMVANDMRRKTPWRYCRQCNCYWSIKHPVKDWVCPESCDGVVKMEFCEECDRKFPNL